MRRSIKKGNRYSTLKAHLPSELVHALEDLVPCPESEPGEQAEVFVYVPFRGRFLEDNLSAQEKKKTYIG